MPFRSFGDVCYVSRPRFGRLRWSLMDLRSIYPEVIASVVGCRRQRVVLLGSLPRFGGCGALFRCTLEHLVTLASVVSRNLGPPASSDGLLGQYLLASCEDCARHSSIRWLAKLVGEVCSLWSLPRERFDTCGPHIAQPRSRGLFLGVGTVDVLDVLDVWVDCFAVDRCVVDRCWVR